MNTETKNIEDQRLPWQKEGWVDPYEKYNRLNEEFRTFLNLHDVFIMIRDRLEEIIKEEKQPPHDWAKEGF